MAVTAVENKVVVAYDCEGTDSAERVFNNEENIEEKIGVFACAVSDVMIINLWYNDIGRF